MEGKNEVKVFDALKGLSGCIITLEYSYGRILSRMPHSSRTTAWRVP